MYKNLQSKDKLVYILTMIIIPCILIAISGVINDFNIEIAKIILIIALAIFITLFIGLFIPKLKL